MLDVACNAHNSKDILHKVSKHSANISRLQDTQSTPKDT